MKDQSKKAVKAAPMKHESEKVVPMKQEIVKRDETALASPYANPWLEAEAEVGSDLGKILKFIDGVYKVGEDEVEIGTKRYADATSTQPNVRNAYSHETT